MTAHDNITGHYGGDGEIARRIDEQLRLSGLTDDRTLSPSYLAAVDQFHVGGLEATQELARLFSPSQGSYVLDIGSGLGRPSRYLAVNYSCRVIGIDITEELPRRFSSRRTDGAGRPNGIPSRRRPRLALSRWTLRWCLDAARVDEHCREEGALRRN